MIDDLNPQPAPAKAPKFKYQLEAQQNEQQQQPRQQRALGLPPRSGIAAPSTPAPQTPTPLAKPPQAQKSTTPKKTKTKSQANPKKQTGYQAAVPITVYRELAQEVQNLRTEIAQVRDINNQLTTQNQQMHRTLASIAAAVQTVGIAAADDTQFPVHTDHSEYSEPEAYPIAQEYNELPPPEPYETEGEDWVMSMEPPGQHPLIERLRNGEFSSILTWVIIISLFVLTVGGSFFLVNIISGQSGDD